MPETDPDGRSKKHSDERGVGTNNDPDPWESNDDADQNTPDSGSSPQKESLRDLLSGLYSDSGKDDIPPTGERSTSSDDPFGDEPEFNRENEGELNDPELNHELPPPPDEMDIPPELPPEWEPGQNGGDLFSDDSPAPFSTPGHVEKMTKEDGTPENDPFDFGDDDTGVDDAESGNGGSYEDGASKRTDAEDGEGPYDDGPYDDGPYDGEDPDSFRDPESDEDTDPGEDPEDHGSPSDPIDDPEEDIFPGSIEDNVDDDHTSEDQHETDEPGIIEKDVDLREDDGDDEGGDDHDDDEYGFEDDRPDEFKSDVPAHSMEGALPSEDDTNSQAEGQESDKSRSPEVDTGTQRAIDTGRDTDEDTRSRIERNIRQARDVMRTQLSAYYNEMTGKEGKDRKPRTEQIFNPIMIGMQEFIMLFSGLMLFSIFLIFFFFEDIWYDNFNAINNIVLIIFGLIAVSGFLLFFFIDSDTPRLRGSMRKKVVFSIIGLILLVASIFYALSTGNTDGAGGLSNGIVASFGLFCIIISSQSMSKNEVYRFFPFYVGAVTLTVVPIHESMNVYPSDFGTLPLDPLNFALVVIGASLTILGIYLLRERSGYFGVWLFGILIFSIIPLHENPDIGFDQSQGYAQFDQTIAIIGAFLLLSGYMMFFYRYRQFMAMSGSIYLGNRSFEQGHTTDAERQYRKAFWILEKMGNIMDYDVIWGNLGNIYARKGEHNAALAYFEMGITINPRNDVLWNDKGNLFHTTRQYRKAIHAYKKGIEFNDQNPVLFQNLAVAQSAIGHHEEALLNYDLAISLDPKYEKAWHNKGKSYHDLGDFEGALTAYDAALRLNQESYAWLDRGDVLYLLERFDEALKSYDRSIKSFSDNPEVWIHRGVCLYALQMYEKAISDFRKAIELDESLTVPYNLLGNAFAQLGDLNQAKQFYGIAVQKKANYSRARFNLARTLAKLNEDAIEVYESAIRITARQRLNEVWFEEAIQYYNEIIDRTPEDSRAWKGRANLLLKIGKMSSAISSYLKAIEFEPNHARTYNLLGIAQRRTQQLEDALASFNKATRLEPNYYEAWNNKGNVLFLMGHFHEALQSYNQAIDLKPDYRSAIQNRHRCITQLKSDIMVESVPLKSTVEDYMVIIETYREQGFKVDILENLLQEGKPHIILSGFEDYKRRVSRLKTISSELPDLDIKPELKDRIEDNLNDPALINVILEVIDAAKRKRTRHVFEKLQKLGTSSGTDEKADTSDEDDLF